MLYLLQCNAKIYTTSFTLAIQKIIDKLTFLDKKIIRLFQKNLYLTNLLTIFFWNLSEHQNLMDNFISKILQLWSIDHKYDSNVCICFRI